ncbi:MAG: peptidylprolyl isomerase [Anaerolineae bacterium]
MRFLSSLRILLPAAVLFSVVACQPKSGTVATPMPVETGAATAQPTMTAISASPETQTSSAVTPVAEAPTATLSLAEQSKARQAAIAQALTNIELPKDGDIVAAVNGEGITVDHLREFMNLRMDGLSSQYGIDWSQPEIEPLVIQVQSEVLEQLIEMRLISQGAEKAGIVVDEAELAGLTFEVQQSIVGSQGFATWEEYLDTVGLSQDSFDAILSQSLLVNGLILAQSTSTEAEQVHARHILVTDPDLAAQLVERIAAGEDFAELAKANSEDTGTAPNGGDLDWFPRGMMVSEFEDAAFALEVGETSGVITTTYGFHIIQVIEKGSRVLSEASRQQLQQGVFIDWLENERAQADIQRYVLEAVG